MLVCYFFFFYVGLFFRVCVNYCWCACCLSCEPVVGSCLLLHHREVDVLVRVTGGKGEPVDSLAEADDNLRVARQEEQEEEEEEEE